MHTCFLEQVHRSLLPWSSYLVSIKQAAWFLLFDASCRVLCCDQSAQALMPNYIDCDWFNYWWVAAWFCWLTPSDCPVQCPKDWWTYCTAFTTTRLQSDCPVNQSGLLDANAMWPGSTFHSSLSCQGHTYSAPSVWSGYTHFSAQCSSSWVPGCG